MSRFRRFHHLPALLILAACGSVPAAGAQTPGPAEGTPLDHVHLYEVPRETTTAQAADTGVVRVNGSASVAVTPDRALVSFAVVTEATGADAAASANADAMNQVLSAVRADGAPGLRLETFGYALAPIYTTMTEDGQRHQRISGYRATNNVRATTTDVDAVGGVIDAAINAGANRVAGLSFEASDTRDARRTALQQAVAQARDEAETIAAALGRTLGAPLEVNGGVSTPVPQDRMYRMAEAVMVTDTPIEVGDQTVQAQVSITFALGPETTRR